MSRRPAGTPTTKPAIHVEKSGVQNRGCTRLKMRGSKPSRDMANHTRAWPSWKTSSEEIMRHMSAPIRTTKGERR